jgi:hypothetical protein
MVAQKTGMKPEDVKKDWIAGMFPGLQLMPSGVVAINGAQERGCSYCFAGNTRTTGKGSRSWMTMEI